MLVSGGITAENGEIVATSEQAAQAVVAFWKPVFTRDDSKWNEEDASEIASACGASVRSFGVPIDLEKFCLVIESRKEAGTGPDKVAYAAWKASGTGNEGASWTVPASSQLRRPSA